MKRISTFIITILIFAFILAVSCNTSGSSRNTEQGNSAIEPGVYEQQAQRTLVGDSMFSASPVGGFFQQSLRFFEEDTIRIEVQSDISNENGVARGQYSASGDTALTVAISSSTTSVYSSGNTISFEPIQLVDESFSETFPDGNQEFVFHGPGLILHNRQPDRNDLDQDGNTFEIVDEALYFKFIVRFD